MAAKEPMFITEAAPWLRDKHPSFFCMPLVSGGEVVGIVNLYHPGLKRLNLGQAELLKAFACQAALVIEKARLREATRQAEAVSTLLQEMHHRIKNSLQMVADLLYLEVKNCESRSAVRSLLASIRRIKSIAAAHEILSIEPPPLTDAKMLAKRLARVSHDSLVGPDSRIDITVGGESLLLSSRQTMALALVMNELLSNCLRHAFVDQERGAVNTCLECHRSLGGKHEEITTAWEGGIHSHRGVGCVHCHGGDPGATDMATSMSPETGYIGVPAKADIPALCASCYSNVDQMRQYNLPTDQWAKFRESVHGQRLEEGDTRVATCFDCHGGHRMNPANEPSSTVYPTNIPAMCDRCHSDAEYYEAL